MENTNYKVGDKVKVTIPAFEKTFGTNEWIVNGLSEDQPNDGRIRYTCYRANDNAKMLFKFFDGEIVLL